MARKPRPSEIAAREAKAAKAKPKPAKKAAAKKREAKHGGKVITREDILEAEQLNNVPATIKLPSAKYIHDFVTKTLVNLDKEKDSAVADIRNAHGTAQDKNHVEKRAMSIAIRLHKMPDSKLQSTMYHLTHYIAALGLWERALKQSQLDLDRVASAGDEDAEEGEDAAEGAEEGTTNAAPQTGGARMTIVDQPTNVTSLADAMADSIARDEASKVA